MSEPPLEADLRSATRAAWNRFLTLVDPLRPDLFRYCRRLTGNVWDAEDLIQDTLEQAFARLGTLNSDVANPAAYVLRIASHLWIDRLRRQDLHARSAELTPAVSPDTPGSDAQLRVREAADRMMSRLAPQERAALVLKEVFQHSLEEIAGLLGTSVGAIKAALHRGRACSR